MALEDPIVEVKESEAAGVGVVNLAEVVTREENTAEEESNEAEGEIRQEKKKGNNQKK